MNSFSRTLKALAAITMIASAPPVHADFLSSISQAVSGAFGNVASPSHTSSLYPSAQQAHNFNACLDELPGGRALDISMLPAQWKPAALCSDEFAVIYSELSKTPLLVVEKINAAELKDAQGEIRTDEFFPDPRIPESSRADLDDYKNSGYDRGHMAPAADATSPHAMAQSFSLSNMIPQNPENNRKIWSKLEGDVRAFARRAKVDVFVFTGPLFDKNVRTIGRSKVWVPDRIFKLVFDAANGRAWAYVIPNTATARIEKPVSYDEFVRLTGWKLFLQ